MSTPAKEQFKSEYSGSVASYTIGFVSSILLTLLAYILVVTGIVSGWTAIVAIFILAVIQCAIQLIFFLNLGKAFGPNWKLATYISMLVLTFVIAGGSIWVMRDLDYRMTLTPEEMTKYMDKETGL